jgi:hypothetical protein
MPKTLIEAGDVIKLLKQDKGVAQFALVLEVNKSEFLGDGGWITFDYVVLSENGEIVKLTGCCIETVVSSNLSPSTWLHSSCSSD